MNKIEFKKEVVAFTSIISDENSNETLMNEETKIQSKSIILEEKVSITQEIATPINPDQNSLDNLILNEEIEKSDPFEDMA